MISFHIHIEGQVQGVGFRPYVSRMAKDFGLTGWVSNGLDGVHAEVCGDERQCNEFYKTLIENSPQNARIVRQSIYEIENFKSDSFKIIESTSTGAPSLLVTPDLGICSSCKQEVLSGKNRRYHYPFITCTQCGPRYSIMRALPYDRINTTMKEFDQCNSCLTEYHNVNDKRYYSQTNSCPNCAITLSLRDSSGQLLSTDVEQIMQLVSDKLDEGKIVAMKNIGGYLLLCDATNAAAVEYVRRSKHRPTKPFAVLYPSLDSLRVDAFISDREEEALLSAEAPIVLLKSKKKTAIAHTVIAPHLDRIGVMLPYTPLMVLLMQSWNKPLVATSANETGSPIFYQDDPAFQNLQGIADYFITHNREIVIPQDDSVVRFTKDDQRIILRRSRGLAPTFLPHPFEDESKTWLAMGSDMKSAFALLNQSNVYISQYLGDLENFETQESYTHTLNHWKKLLGAEPEQILVDKHPIYFSSMLGKRLASEALIPVTSVQHHEAHFCAVLAENNLLDKPEPVLGIIWDGTGWGNDNNIWGGEFFRYEFAQIERVDHLDYFDHVLGDKISREPRLSALSLCKDIPEAEAILKSKFTGTEWNLYSKILSKPNVLQTSSIGRLFDGVASLLGLCDRSSYEGEPALYLEALATKAAEKLNGHDARWQGSKVFSLQQEILHILKEIESGTPEEVIAYQFHLNLVRWIHYVAEKQNVKRLAFSGGVFQNALLVHLIQRHFDDTYQLYFHHQLSPNDECIGLGQLAWLYIQQHVQTDEQKLEYILAHH